MPAGGPAGALEVGVAVVDVSFEQAARADPAPTARTVMPPARSRSRRETALTMSPKYSPSLVLLGGCAHASPQR
jgi:hypothetical protein